MLLGGILEIAPRASTAAEDRLARRRTGGQTVRLRFGAAHGCAPTAETATAADAAAVTL